MNRIKSTVNIKILKRPRAVRGRFLLHLTRRAERGTMRIARVATAGVLLF